MGRDSYFDPYPYIVLQSYKWDDWLRWRAFLGWVCITNQIILTYSRITCYGSDCLVDHGPIFMPIRFKFRETHVKISIIQRWTSGFWSKFPAKFLNPVNFLKMSIQNPIFFQNSIEFWKIHLLALGCKAFRAFVWALARHAEDAIGKPRPRPKRTQLSVLGETLGTGEAMWRCTGCSTRSQLATCNVIKTY